MNSVEVYFSFFIFFLKEQQIVRAYMEKRICPHRSHVGSQNQDIVEMFFFVSVPVGDAPSCRSHGELGTDPPDSRPEPQPGPVCGPQEARGGLSFCASGLFVASACNSLFVSPEPVLFFSNILS